MLAKLSIHALLISTALLLSNCASEKSKESSASDAKGNPLLQKWEGPYNGVPPFDKIEVTHFKPALEAAMAANREEINNLVASTDAPTFQNTIEALEKTGTTLRRVLTVYG